MITELMQRHDGRHAKRNKLLHVITKDAGDYEGSHRKDEDENSAH